ncbi:MAG: DUF3822 family protein [Bacteroidia bacterium]|nr:DUF3822 family protein [Bacteroidia bacterium]
MTVVKALPVQDIYASSTLNLAASSSYNLGVYLDIDHLLYVISTDRHEPLFIRSYKNRDGLELSRFLEAAWQQDDMIRKRYAHVLVLIDADRWMIVPAEYVSEGQEMAYLQAYYDIRPSSVSSLPYVAQKDILKGSGATFLYLVPVSLKEYLYARSGSIEFHHASYRYTQLSRYLIENHLQHRPYAGMVWLFLGTFYYCLFGGDRLLFVNRFTAATAEDVLYYIQGLHNLLGISKEQVAISVSGYSGLKPYVATILYRFFGAGYKDLGKVYIAPSTLKEAGLGGEDVLALTFAGADTAG